MTGPDHLASLLAVARDELRSKLMPGLDAGGRYQAAMIANAMGIAARAFSAGAEAETRRAQALAALYPDAADADPARLERRLARELRQGRLEVEREERVRAVLLARTLSRLEIVNPDYAATFTRPQAP